MDTVTSRQQQHIGRLLLHRLRRDGITMQELQELITTYSTFSDFLQEAGEVGIGRLLEAIRDPVWKPSMRSTRLFNQVGEVVVPELHDFSVTDAYRVGGLLGHVQLKHYDQVIGWVVDGEATPMFSAPAAKLVVYAVSDSRANPGRIVRALGEDRQYAGGFEALLRLWQLLQNQPTGGSGALCAQGGANYFPFWCGVIQATYSRQLYQGWSLFAHSLTSDHVPLGDIRVIAY